MFVSTIRAHQSSETSANAMCLCVKTGAAPEWTDIASSDEQLQTRNTLWRSLTTLQHLVENKSLHSQALGVPFVASLRFRTGR